MTICSGFPGTVLAYAGYPSIIISTLKCVLLSICGHPGKSLPNPRSSQSSWRLTCFGLGVGDRGLIIKLYKFSLHMVSELFNENRKVTLSTDQNPLMSLFSFMQSQFLCTSFKLIPFLMSISFVSTSAFFL